MDAKGVTPMPAPTIMTVSKSQTFCAGAPNGPHNCNTTASLCISCPEVDGLFSRVDGESVPVSTAAALALLASVARPVTVEKSVGSDGISNSFFGGAGWQYVIRLSG